MNLLEGCGIITCLSSGTTYDPLQFKKFVLEKKDLLISHGVQSGDRVLLLNNNTVDFIAMLFAVWSINAVAVPADSKIKFSSYEKFLKEYLIHFVYDGMCLDHVNVDLTSKEKKHYDIDLILLSSGTTGVAKGIGFNKKNIFNRVHSITKSYGADASRTLCLLPTSFGHGLIANTLAHFLTGKHVFLSPKFDLDVALNLGKTIDKFSITLFSSVPALWNLIMASKARPPIKCSLKQVHCASAFLHFETYAFARSWVLDSKFYINYGLTECASWICGGELPQNPLDYKVGFVGRPIDCNIIIKNPNENGHGLVCVESKSIPQKYFGPEEKNICDAFDGFLKTGDLGYFKDDNLYLTGRISDFINQGGEKISPLEIEASAISFPYVLQAVALPVSHNILGEQVGLIIKIKDAKLFNINDLKLHLSKNLPTTKIPKVILVVDHIPLGINQKINRIELKKHFQDSLKK